MGRPLLDFTPDRPLVETCRGCDLTHKHVEASGIWSCPNPLCTATGAYWIREKIGVTEPNEGGGHTIPDVELWIERGMAAAVETGDEAIIAAAARQSVKLRERTAPTEDDQ